MDAKPRICVVVPVYNHGLTVRAVAAGAKAHFPVIVVNDGSTDQTRSALSGEAGIVRIDFPENHGKAAALTTGFARALEMGFTHAISIDADGQHPVAALPNFANACCSHPEALIIGVRDLKAEEAPKPRRWSNALSTFWFRFETGSKLADTQCGYRVYPLRELQKLTVRSDRYAYELEVMVKAAWAGIPLVACPVRTDYAAPTSKLSHFDPIRDFWRIARLHSRLSIQAFCLPAPLRRLMTIGALKNLPRGRRVRSILSHLFTEHTETPARLASAVGVGLFCGIAPIWGAQMLAAAVLAHKLCLNKAIALTASNVSFPLAAPFILAGGLMLGHFVWTGSWMRFDARLAPEQVPVYLAQWLLGSVLLALLAGSVGAVVTYVIARCWRAPKTNPVGQPGTR